MQHLIEVAQIDSQCDMSSLFVCLFLVFWFLTMMVCLALRFTEALEYLEQGLALVNKLGDEKLAAYRWPGSQVIIEDTKPGKLLVIVFLTYLKLCLILIAVHVLSGCFE